MASNQPRSEQRLVILMTAALALAVLATSIWSSVSAGLMLFGSRSGWKLEREHGLSSVFYTIQNGGQWTLSLTHPLDLADAQAIDEAWYVGTLSSWRVGHKSALGFRDDQWTLHEIKYFDIYQVEPPIPSTRAQSLEALPAGAADVAAAALNQNTLRERIEAMMFEFHGGKGELTFVEDEAAINAYNRHLGTRYITIVILTPLSIALALLAWRGERKRRRRLACLCIHCGYSLIHSTSTCPECGKLLAAS